MNNEPADFGGNDLKRRWTGRLRRVDMMGFDDAAAVIDGISVV